MVHHNVLAKIEPNLLVCFGESRLLALFASLWLEIMANITSLWLANRAYQRLEWGLHQIVQLVRVYFC